MIDFYSNGGFREEDLLTNFSGDQLELYEKAVKDFGDNTLFISDKAYDINGIRLSGVYSLRTARRGDRTDFWRLFDKLKEQK